MTASTESIIEKSQERKTRYANLYKELLESIVKNDFAKCLDTSNWMAIAFGLAIDEITYLSIELEKLKNGKKDLDINDHIDGMTRLK